MNEDEKIIEENLKARLSHITPSRVSFEQVMVKVTSINDNRSIILKGDTPSLYQSIYTIFVKKITLIGLPIVALALFLVYINFSINPKMEEVTLPIAQENNGLAVLPSDSQVDPNSVDGIIDAIISESDSDIVVAMNDTEDDSIVSEELANYNEITIYDYENSI